MGGNYSTNLFGSVYGYLYCKMNDLRIFNNNSGAINTALLFSNNTITHYRNNNFNNNNLSNYNLEYRTMDSKSSSGLIS